MDKSLKRVYFCPLDLKYEEIGPDGKPTGRTFSTPMGYPSDGATKALDIWSYSFFAHDRACDVGKWDDGTEMTYKEASIMMAWYLRKEQRTKMAWWREKAVSRFGPKKLGEAGECFVYPELAGRIEILPGGRDSLYRKQYPSEWPPVIAD